MQCPSCNAKVGATAKFCEECGHGLPRVCATCGHANAAQAKFCAECGTATGTATFAKGAMPKRRVDESVSALSPAV